MDYKEFISFMDTSGTSHKEAIPNLQNYVHEFPYFQTAQALLAKAFREQEHVRYDKQLKIAAAYCGDRKSLYALIHHKPASVFVESESTSPFVSGSNLIAQSEEENPFTESTTFIEENNQFTETKIEDLSVFETIVNSPKVENEEILYIEEEESMSESEPSFSSADPHDIIRERLKEILKEKVNDDEPLENKIVSDQIVLETPVTLDPIDTIVTETTFNESIIQSIAKESEHRKDDVDLGELEYALEATIIHSLEKLPLLEKTKEPERENEEIDASVSMTFFDWLKKKQGNGFGKVEEVHADDQAVSISKTEVTGRTVPVAVPESDISHEAVINQSEVQHKTPEVEKLIDKFIATEPRIVASKTEFFSPANQAKKSIMDDEDLVSETLAKIYRHQGALLKARSAYQKLILLHPEKKAYFAALIEEIDNQHNNPDKQDL